MNAQSLLQLLLLLDTLLNKGPQFVSALKQLLAGSDEAELKAQLAALEQSNDADYQRAKDLLAGIINAG